MKIMRNDMRTLIVFVVALLLIPFATDADAQRRSSAGRSSASRPSSTRQTTSRPTSSGRNRTTNRPSTNDIKRGNGNNNIRRGNGSNNNIHRGNNNVNVNINNRNTVVRPSTMPYRRAPYRYGGHSYYTHHVYVYHGYRPFFWGPAWHPWGYVAATLTAAAIVIAVNNQKYHYDSGVYYVYSSAGYTVVAAPVGATITTLPPGYQVVPVSSTVNNYYYGGTYYVKSDKGYTVVAPTAGTIVENLPEGGKEVTVGSKKYVKIGETYYQPITVDGKEKYEVVEVK